MREMPSKGHRQGWTGAVMLGLLALGATAGGCGGGGSAPPPSCPPAALHTSWSVSANGVPVSCAMAGATEVDFIIDAMEVPFPCTDLVDTSPDFDAGPHSVSLELRDLSQNVL